MTRGEVWDVTKTVVAIVYGILGLLAVFGPLAQYREYLLLAAGIVSIVASSLGMTLTRPTEQVQAVRDRKMQIERANDMMGDV